MQQYMREKICAYVEYNRFYRVFYYSQEQEVSQMIEKQES